MSLSYSSQNNKIEENSDFYNLVREFIHIDRNNINELNKVLDKFNNHGNIAILYLINVIEDENNNSNMKHAVLRLLGYLKNKEAVPKLIEFLSSEDFGIRFYSTWALGQIGDESAFNALLKATDDKDIGISDNAFAALFRIDIKEKRNDLVKHLRLLIDNYGKDSNFTLRYYADAINQLALLKDPKSIDLLLLAITDEDDELQKAAYPALKEMLKDDHSKLLDRFKKMDKDKIPYYFLSLLGELKVREVIPSLKSIAESGSEEEKIGAIGALCIMNEPEAAKKLTEYLTYYDWAKRKNVAKILKKYNWDTEDLKLKTYYYLSLEDWERLEKIGEPAIPILVKEYFEYRASENEIRKMIGVFRKIGQPAAYALLNKLNDINPPSNILAEAIAAMPREWVFDRLKQLAIGEQCSNAKANAILALGMMKEAVLLDLFIKEIGNNSGHCSEASTRALGELKDPSTIDQLYKCALRGEWSSEDCARAMRIIGSEKGIEALKKLMLASNHYVREQAAYGLSELGWTAVTDEEKVQYLIASEDYSAVASYGSIAADTFLKIFTNPKSLEYSDIIEACQYVYDTRLEDRMIALLSEKPDKEEIEAALTVLSVYSTKKAAEIVSERWHQLDSSSQMTILKKIKTKTLEQAKTILLIASLSPDKKISNLAREILNTKGWKPVTEFERNVLRIQNSEWENISIDDMSLAKYLLNYLQNEYVNQIEDIAYVLVRYGPKLAPELKRLFEVSENDSVKACILNILGEYKLENMRSFYQQNLYSEREEIRVSAIKAFSKIMLTEDVDIFKAMLKDTNPSIRKTVVQCLPKTDWDQWKPEDKIQYLIAAERWEEIPPFGELAIKPLINEIKRIDEIKREWDYRNTQTKYKEGLNHSTSAANTLSKIGLQAEDSLVDIILESDSDAAVLAFGALEKMGWKPSAIKEKARYYNLKKDSASLIKMGMDGLDQYINLLRDLSEPEQIIYAQNLMKMKDINRDFLASLLTSSNTRDAFSNTCLSILSKQPLKSSIDILVTIVSGIHYSGDKEKYETVLISLGKSAEKKLLTYLKKGSIAEKIAVIPLLAQLQSDEAYSIFMDTLRFENERLNPIILESLGFYKDGRSLPFLLECINMENFRGCEYIIKSLANSGNDGQRELVKLLLNKKEYIRKEAARGLDSMEWTPNSGDEAIMYSIASEKWDDVVSYGPKVVDKLISLAETKDKMRFWDNKNLFDALLKINTKEARDFVFGALINYDGYYSYEYGALLSIVAIDHMKEIRERFRKSSSKLQESMLITALGNLKDTESVPDIIKCLKKYDREVKQSAAVALIRIGEKSGLDAVLDAIKSGQDWDMPELFFEYSYIKDDNRIFPVFMDYLEASESYSSHSDDFMAKAVANFGRPLPLEKLEKIYSHCYREAETVMNEYLLNLAQSANTDYLLKYLLSTNEIIQKIAIDGLEKIKYVPKKTDEKILIAIAKNDVKTIQKYKEESLLQLIAMIDRSHGEKLNKIYTLLENLVDKSMSSLFINHLESNQLEIRYRSAELLEKIEWQPLTDMEKILFAIVKMDRVFLKAQGQKAIPFLIDLLQNDKSDLEVPNSRLSMQEFGSDVLSQLGAQAVEAVITAAYNGPDFGQRNWFSITLKKMALEHYQQILSYIDDTDPRITKRVINAVEDLDLKIIAPKLMELLYSNPTEYDYLIWILKKDAEFALQEAKKMMKNPNPKIRKLALYLFKDIKTSQANELILEMLNDKDPVVLDTMLNTIEFEKIKTGGRLAPLFQSKNLETRHIAILMAAKSGESEYIPFLTRMLKDDSRNVRIRAAMVLQDFNWRPETTELKVLFYFMLEKWDEIKKIGKTAVPYIKKEMEDGNASALLFETLRFFKWKPKDDYETVLEDYFLNRKDEIIKMGDRAVEPLIKIFQTMYSGHSSFPMSEVFEKIGDPRFIDLIINTYDWGGSFPDYDYMDTLKKMSGTDFKDNQKDWQKWWEQNKNRFLAKEKLKN
jgi:HEAT repeat protein